MTAPVQVLVIGVEDTQFDGSVRVELDRLRDTGTVRVLDVLLVTRAGDGSFSTLPPPAGFPEGTGSVVAGLLGTGDEEPDASVATGSDDPDAGWSLDGAVPTGATAVVALVEHLWAEPLRDAVRAAGGSPLGETWLAEEDLERLSGLLGDRSR
jgi:hypothetical protein